MTVQSALNFSAANSQAFAEDFLPNRTGAEPKPPKNAAVATAALDWTPSRYTTQRRPNAFAVTASAGMVLAMIAAIGTLGFTHAQKQKAAEMVVMDLAVEAPPPPGT